MKAHEIGAQLPVPRTKFREPIQVLMGIINIVQSTCTYIHIQCIQQTLLSKVTDGYSYIHSYTDGGGWHASCWPAHQEQFGVQYFAQGHFDVQTRGNWTSDLLITRCWLYPRAAAAYFVMITESKKKCVYCQFNRPNFKVNFLRSPALRVNNVIQSSDSLMQRIYLCFFPPRVEFKIAADSLQLWDLKFRND